MPTKTLKCSCVSEFQDGRYSSGKRIFNQCLRSGKVAWRCTVCGYVVEEEVKRKDVLEEQEEK